MMTQRLAKTLLRYRTEKLASGDWNQRTAQMSISIIHVFLRWLEERNLLCLMKTRLLPESYVDLTGQVAITFDEYRRLVAVCSTPVGREFRWAIQIAWETGLDMVTIGNLRWSQIDMNAELLRVGLTTIPASSELMLTLSEALAGRKGRTDNVLMVIANGLAHPPKKWRPRTVFAARFHKAKVFKSWDGFTWAFIQRLWRAGVSSHIIQSMVPGFKVRFPTVTVDDQRTALYRARLAQLNETT